MPPPLQQGVQLVARLMQEPQLLRQGLQLGHQLLQLQPQVQQLTMLASRQQLPSQQQQLSSSARPAVCLPGQSMWQVRQPASKTCRPVQGRTHSHG
jgi:hypothetical protein